MSGLPMGHIGLATGLLGAKYKYTLNILSQQPNKSNARLLRPELHVLKIKFATNFFNINLCMPSYILLSRDFGNVV